MFFRRYLYNLAVSIVKSKPVLLVIFSAVFAFALVMPVSALYFDYYYFDYYFDCYFDYFD